MTKNATFFFESTFLGPHFNDPKMTNVDREKMSSPRAKVHILVGPRSTVRVRILSTPSKHLVLH